MSKKWKPLDENILSKINSLFLKTYPENEYGNLAEKSAGTGLNFLKKLG